jgi:hypothetical protein
MIVRYQKNGEKNPHPPPPKKKAILKKALLVTLVSSRYGEGVVG